MLAMKDDYLNWSSRLFINFPIHVLVTHRLVWAVCNTIVMLLFIRGMEQLVFSKSEPRYRWYTLGVLLLLPWNFPAQSGWIVSSMTYLWPATALLYWLLILKRYISRNKIRPMQLAGSVLLGLYATNLEQIAVFGAVVMVGVCIYLAVEHKKRRWVLLWIGVLCVGFMIHLMVPGESVRFAQEVGDQFPNYPMLNFINKIDLGISSAMMEFLEQINFPYLLFAYLLLAAVKAHREEAFYQVIASIPLALGVLWPLSSTLLSGTKYDISRLNITDMGAVTTSNCILPWGYYYILIAMGCAVCIGLSLLVAFDSLGKGIVMASLFVGAYCSRGMMAFSPTIWASGERTYFIMYIVFLGLALFLLEERCRRPDIKRDRTFCSVLTMGAAYSVICWLL
jgi:hypothetical protein